MSERDATDDPASGVPVDPAAGGAGDPAPPLDPTEEERSLRDLLLAMPQERTCGDLTRRVVRHLASRRHVALARIWLLKPGDICSRCPRRDECPGNIHCLHLAASAGRSVVAPDLEWSRIDGEFRRFPMGVRKVGHVGETCEPLEITNVAHAREWIARPEWANAERIRGFVAQPMLFHEALVGVLAVFLRVDAVPGQMDWLRLIADHLAVTIMNARAFEQIVELRQRLELENEYLREEVHDAADFGDIVGRGAAVQAILRQVELVAPTESTVLITGESGTGKELVAREIHRHGARADRAMIRVNCASVPRELFESEFFGHVRGAFTGALRDRVGRFALADGGTLFLDEVGEIPLELQSKLLRVLQEGEYERVGDERPRKTDARVIAATNRDLKREVEAGRFREDLYYRLNVFPIEVPPLRKRLEDIPALVAHFVRSAARKLKHPEPPVTKAELMRLQAHAWSGNVRELQNVIERALITHRRGPLRVALPVSSSSGTRSDVADPPAEAVLDETAMRRLERDNVERALEQTRWKIYGPDGAAALLGLKATTLVSRMRKMGLSRR